MATEGRYKFETYVDGLEAETKGYIKAAKKDQELIEALIEDEGKSKILSEMAYDYDCEILLFKQVLELITTWRSVICITEEKGLIK